MNPSIFRMASWKFAGSGLALIGVSAMLLAPLVSTRIKAADLNPILGVDWIPGDCDQDGKTGLADAIRLIGYLFHGQIKSICAPLCDSNGDSRIDAADPVRLLNFLYTSSWLRPYAHDPREVCDRLDNDCDGIVDENCVPLPDATVTLSWDEVTLDVQGKPEKILGYRIYFGETPGRYPHVLYVGKVITHQVNGLFAGKTYHFAVSAHDASGNESALSSPVSSTAK